MFETTNGNIKNVNKLVNGQSLQTSIKELNYRQPTTMLDHLIDYLQISTPFHWPIPDPGLPAFHG